MVSSEIEEEVSFKIYIENISDFFLLLDRRHERHERFWSYRKYVLNSGSFKRGQVLTGTVIIEIVVSVVVRIAPVYRRSVPYDSNQKAIKNKNILLDFLFALSRLEGNTNGIL